MATNPPRTGRRSWGIVVAALVVIFVLMLLVAMLSEREDSRVLGPAELEGVEEQHR
ncbi:hypothetical protein BH24GEM3_BH24GEM3_06020 [soil metagenome]|jgi:hypothetical protein